MLTAPTLTGQGGVPQIAPGMSEPAIALGVGVIVRHVGTDQLGAGQRAVQIAHDVPPARSAEARRRREED